MKFDIIDSGWCKRRIQPTKAKVIKFELIDFQKIDNHKCKIQVWYDDGNSRLLEATVHIAKLYMIGSTEIKYGRCVVHGYDLGVDSVSLELIE